MLLLSVLLLFLLFALIPLTGVTITVTFSHANQIELVLKMIFPPYKPFTRTLLIQFNCCG